jgi:hypothetical protein
MSTSQELKNAIALKSGNNKSVLDNIFERPTQLQWSGTKVALKHRELEFSVTIGGFGRTKVLHQQETLSSKWSLGMVDVHDFHLHDVQYRVEVRTFSIVKAKIAVVLYADGEIVDVKGVMALDDEYEEFIETLSWKKFFNGLMGVLFYFGCAAGIGYLIGKAIGMYF